jgi:hypothetical protein
MLPDRPVKTAAAALPGKDLLLTDSNFPIYIPA